MKVIDYLQKKYRMTKPSTITAVEAEAFGIPYPLKAGWLAKYGETEITPYMQETVERRMNARLTKSKYQKPKRLEYTQKSLDVLKTKDVQSPVLRKVVQGKSTAAQKDVDPNAPDFLQSYAWRTLRMKALKLHGATCMCCGDTPQNGAIMNVDHIRPRKYFPELALNLNNLQILCSACNQGKSNWDKTDWRDVGKPINQ